MRRVLRPAWVVVLLGACALAGCTDDGPDAGPGDGADRGAESYDLATDTSTYGHPRSEESFDPKRYWRSTYQGRARLDDGRRVRLWYSADGTRLKEQHYSPREGSWTRPRVVHRSDRRDPCQGITVATSGGVVAVAASFGMFCYLGESTGQPVALVADGDLTDWDVHVGGGVDEWTSIEVLEDEVTFSSGAGSVAWTPTDGFAD